jgi:hypothetical protein
MLEFQDHTKCIDLSRFPFNFDTLQEIQDVKPRTERERENREEEGSEPSSVELEPLTISGSLVKICSRAVTGDAETSRWWRRS